MSISRQGIGIVFGIIIFLLMMGELAYVRHNYTPSVEIDQTIEKIAASKNVTVSEKAGLDLNVPVAPNIEDFFREAENKKASRIYYTLAQLDNSLIKSYWIAAENGAITDEYRQAYNTPVKTFLTWPFNLQGTIFDSSMAISIKKYDSKTIEYELTNPIISYVSYAIMGGFIAFFAGYLLWLLFFLLDIERIGKHKVT